MVSIPPFSLPLQALLYLPSVGRSRNWCRLAVECFLFAYSSFILFFCLAKALYPMVGSLVFSVFGHKALSFEYASLNFISDCVL